MGTVAALLTYKQPAAGGSYNDRAQFLFDQLFALEAVSLGATIEGHINDFFDELIANGTIHATDTDGSQDLISALYLFDLGSAAATKYNVLRPLDADAQFRLSYSGGWTYNGTGAVPNGTNGFANTHFIPNTHAALTGFIFGTYIRTDSKLGTRLYGCYDVANKFAQHNISNENMFSAQIANLITYSRSTTQRLFFHSRRTGSDSETYQDATSIGSETVAATSTLPPHKFYWGGRNNQDTTIDFYDNHEYSIGVLGATGFSDADVTAFTTAVNNYATARGFNV